MSKEVRIGIVGLKLGMWQIETIAELQGGRVTAVAELTTEVGVPGVGNMSSQDYAKSIGAAFYRDGVELIEQAELDGVSLAVAPKYRDSLMAAAVEKRVPILMEKPMACDLTQGRRWAKMAAQAGLFFMMEYPIRYFPVVQRLKSLLAPGPLGKVLSVTAELQTQWNPGGQHWMWDPRNGNGLLNESVTHLYDTICFICGQPVRLFAAGGNFKGSSTIEDSAGIVIEFANGSHALANGGGLGTKAFNTPLHVHVYAENGEAKVTGPCWMFDRINWAASTDDAIHEEVFELPPRRQIMRYSMQRFIECLRNNESSDCTAADGLNALRITEGIKQSLREKQAVTIQGD